MSEPPMSWADQLALIIARCRFGPGIDMGGRSNPQPTEIGAARRFVEDITAAARAEGYAEAVAKLRYGQRIADRAWQANTAALDLSLGVAANFLEAQAVKENTDA